VKEEEVGGRDNNSEVKSGTKRITFETGISQVSAIACLSSRISPYFGTVTLIFRQRKDQKKQKKKKKKGGEGNIHH